MGRGEDEIDGDDAPAQCEEETNDAFLHLDDDGPAPKKLLHPSPTATAADPSFVGVLALAVREVSALVPAERVILFVYDKNTHLLVPRFVNSVPVEHCDDEKHPEAPPNGNAGEPTGFPPVMGLVSACFLHKRCLRMQEPHPHRAFHREYDAPRGMTVDSILCAPIILHHRVIGVIELLNRMDLEDDASYVSFEALARLGAQSSPATTNDDEREIKLHRLKTVKPHARVGFSSKDEQRLIQFASHVAQAVESKLKQIARHGESQDKLREEHAKSALALLGMLNEKLDYQNQNRPSLKAFIRKPALVEPELSDADVDLPDDRRKVERSPLVDSLLMLMAIVKMQAMFRGRRERRAHNFDDALEKFRVQTQKIRSAILIQRLAKGSFVRRRVRQQRCAVRMLSRVYKAFKFRVTLETRIKQKKKARTAVPSLAASVTFPVHVKPRFPKREPVVPQDVGRFRPKVVAESSTSKDVNAPVNDAACVNGSHRVAIVKLQSFVRGSLARKHIKEMMIVHRTMRPPTVVCLRIASTPSSGDPSNLLGEAVESQYNKYQSDRCVYAMPGRTQTAAHLVHRRSCATRGRLEELYDYARNSAMTSSTTRLLWEQSNNATRGLAGDKHKPTNCYRVTSDESSDNNAFTVATRRLAPSLDKLNGSAPRSAAPFDNSSASNERRQLFKVCPGFAFAPSRTAPGTVEFTAATRADKSDDEPRSSNQQSHADESCRHAATYRQRALYAVLQMASPSSLPRLVHTSDSPVLQQRQERGKRRPKHALLCCLLPASAAPHRPRAPPPAGRGPVRSVSHRQLVPHDNARAGKRTSV